LHQQKNSSELLPSLAQVNNGPSLEDAGKEQDRYGAHSKRQHTVMMGRTFGSGRPMNPIIQLMLHLERICVASSAEWSFTIGTRERRAPS
jgi:hypothetical protein